MSSKAHKTVWKPNPGEAMRQVATVRATWRTMD